MRPPHDSSNTWGPLPAWMAASITDSFPAVPAREPRRPKSRPDTLRVVPPISTAALMGRTKRASPPPDLARVASQFALLGALVLALVLSWAFGG